VGTSTCFGAIAGGVMFWDEKEAGTIPRSKRTARCLSSRRPPHPKGGRHKARPRPDVDPSGKKKGSCQSNNSLCSARRKAPFTWGWLGETGEGAKICQETDARGGGRQAGDESGASQKGGSEGVKRKKKKLGKMIPEKTGGKMPCHEDDSSKEWGPKERNGEKQAGPNVAFRIQ